MLNSFPFQEPDELQNWYQNIEQANRNNIFCHCRACNYEWIDSSTSFCWVARKRSQPTDSLMSHFYKVWQGSLDESCSLIDSSGTRRTSML